MGRSTLHLKSPKIRKELRKNELKFAFEFEIYKKMNTNFTLYCKT